VAHPVTAEDLLAEARSGLVRLDPPAAAGAVEAGAVLVDIRSELQRECDGVVPGSVFFPRNVLEWRCDPASPARDERVCDPARQLNPHVRRGLPVEPGCGEPQAARLRARD
jgi:hypothetical protein